jgi:hypothetical protein
VRTDSIVNESSKDLLVLPIPPVELLPQSVASAGGDRAQLEIVANLSRQYNSELTERVRGLGYQSIKTWDIEGLHVLFLTRDRLNARNELICTLF